MNKEILQKSIGLLARREHSCVELKRKLIQKDYSAEEIDAVIDWLLENDYISDERFADVIVRHRVEKGYGSRYIQNELSQKGVDANIFQLVVKNYQIDWYLQAELAYNKRFGEKPIKDHKDKAKRIRFLQYRGFASDEIMTAINAD